VLRLPGVPHPHAVKAFPKAGFDTVITIPRHDPVNAFTMAGIVRYGGLTIGAFRKLLQRGSGKTAAAKAIHDAAGVAFAGFRSRTRAEGCPGLIPACQTVHHFDRRATFRLKAIRNIYMIEARRKLVGTARGTES
jgi:hypothetical protein